MWRRKVKNEHRRNKQQQQSQQQQRQKIGVGSDDIVDCNALGNQLKCMHVFCVDSINEFIKIHRTL